MPCPSFLLQEQHFDCFPRALESLGDRASLFWSGVVFFWVGFLQVAVVVVVCVFAAPFSTSKNAGHNTEYEKWASLHA